MKYNLNVSEFIPFFIFISNYSDWPSIVSYILSHNICSSQLMSLVSLLISQNLPTNCVIPLRRRFESSQHLIIFITYVPPSSSLRFLSDGVNGLFLHLLSLLCHDRACSVERLDVLMHASLLLVGFLGKLHYSGLDCGEKPG
jgi:hypothetical protein